ncbi:uncharacterized protein K452DRAFT_298901 [Aplosporella prunicola CBS 121167]|uniref:DUF7587 domain-containing protein n=1 Tax=Aplosporella prunicola CBS 121167 TaxID=1176127 RepID=A0A6A6BB47_9PEZI|nr:uncharacterized protein K452DRAFT_298901 [Aplosporella prunicola CBS 121167]KAF2140818.1 hypothetical protein K452DRAFT_298901 [Aplosporella prunicola CBS 121167]
MSTTKNSNWRSAISLHTSQYNLSFYEPGGQKDSIFTKSILSTTKAVEIVDLTEDTESENDCDDDDASILSCIEVLPCPKPRNRKREKSISDDSGGNKRMRCSPIESETAVIDSHQFVQLPYEKESKNHRWTKEQKIVVCILRRYYINSWRDLAEVFNYHFAISGLAAEAPTSLPEVPLSEEPLSATKMSAQYSDLRRYRLESAWREVYNTPFEDQERWSALQTSLEGRAEALGIRLVPARHQSETEPKHPKGRKTLTLLDRKRIRSIKKKLKLEALHQTWQSAADPSPGNNAVAQGPSPPPSPAPQDSAYKQLQAAADDHQSDNQPSVETDDSETEQLVSKGRSKPGSQPALLYRMYHKGSAGINTPETIRAAHFLHIPNSKIPEPLGNDSQALIYDAALHLWHDQWERRASEGRASEREPPEREVPEQEAPEREPDSRFISCTDSLIFAMSKALAQERLGNTPYITVIDAKAAMANGKGFSAMSLKCRAQMFKWAPSGMRYQARYEWLIWGEIPTSTRLCTLSLAQLRALAIADIDLTLTTLLTADPTHELSVTYLRNARKTHQQVLTPASARAMGGFAAAFGLSLASQSDKLEQFVYNVIQGWCWDVPGLIGDNNGIDDERVRAFAEGLSASNTGGADVTGDEKNRVAKAFLEGMRKARGYLRNEFMRKWRAKKLRSGP